MAIAEDLLYAVDRVRWAEDVLGFTPTDPQRRILSSEARSQILCCHRQWGKTTVTAVRAVHELLYVPDAFVSIVSGGKRQADEAAACIARWLLLFPRKQAAIVRRDEGGWHLGNGSRVLTLPASEAGVRGFSAVTLGIFDEAAVIPQAVAAAAAPMTAARSGSQLVMSTPAGTGGWFADHWRRRGALGYDSVFAPFKPGQSRVTELYVQEERAKWGEWWYRQEFLCEFLDNEEGLVSRDDLVAAQRPGLGVLDI